MSKPYNLRENPRPSLRFAETVDEPRQYNLGLMQNPQDLNPEHEIENPIGLPHSKTPELMPKAQNVAKSSLNLDDDRESLSSILGINIDSDQSDNEKDITKNEKTLANSANKDIMHMIKALREDMAVLKANYEHQTSEMRLMIETELQTFRSEIRTVLEAQNKKLEKLEAQNYNLSIDVRNQFFQMEKLEYKIHSISSELENLHYTQEVLKNQISDIQSVRNHMSTTHEDKIKEDMENFKQEIKNDINILQKQSKVNFESQTKAFENPRIHSTNKKHQDPCYTFMSNHPKQKPLGPTPIVQGPIYAPSNNIVPKFNGRSNNPIEFLNKASEYLNQLQQDYPYHFNLSAILENMMEGSANRWWQMHKDEIQNFHDFKALFEEKYWNEDIQSEIRRNIQSGKHTKLGKMSRTEYFIEKVLVMKNLTPRMTEHDIVKIMSNHFEKTIRDTIRMRGIRSIREMENILSEEDREDKLENQTEMNYSTKRNESRSNNICQEEIYYRNGQRQVNDMNETRFNDYKQKYNRPYHHNEGRNQDLRKRVQGQNHIQGYDREIRDRQKDYRNPNGRFRKEETQAQIHAIQVHPEQQPQSSHHLN